MHLLGSNTTAIDWGDPEAGIRCLLIFRGTCALLLSCNFFPFPGCRTSFSILYYSCITNNSSDRLNDPGVWKIDDLTSCIICRVLYAGSLRNVSTNHVRQVWISGVSTWTSQDREKSSFYYVWSDSMCYEPLLHFSNPQLIRPQLTDIQGTE